VGYSLHPVESMLDSLNVSVVSNCTRPNRLRIGCYPSAMHAPIFHELPANQDVTFEMGEFGGNHLALLLRHALAIALAVFILFEECGWDPLSRLVGKLARLPMWARMERAIGALSPRASLLVLILPWILLLPLKLVTLWLLATGQFALAMATVVAVKIIGTAIVARLFALTCPALMRMGWFASWYTKWTLAKDRLFTQAHATNTWLRIRRLKAFLREGFASWRAVP